MRSSAVHKTHPYLVTFFEARLGVGLVLLLVLACMFAAGCKRSADLPVYEWETTEQALSYLATQNNGMVTFEADVLVRVIDAGEESGWRPGDCLSLNLYAWQHEKVRIDFSQPVFGQVKDEAGPARGAVAGTVPGIVAGTGPGQVESGSGRHDEQDAAGAIGLSRQAWLLFRTGIFRRSPERTADTDDGLLVWKVQMNGRLYTAYTDPRHMVAVEYDIVDIVDTADAISKASHKASDKVNHAPKQGMLTKLRISGFETRGGIVWPTRLLAQSSGGLTLELQFQKIKINEDLPAGIFDPTTATLQPTTQPATSSSSANHKS